MSRTLICAALLTTLTAQAAAQDLEPNVRRGVRSVVGQLALALPTIDPAPEELRIRFEPDVHDEVRGLLVRELTALGFSVAVASEGGALGLVSERASSTLDLHVADHGANPYRRLTVGMDAGERQTFAIRYGDATWVDLADPDTLVVAGPLASTASDALQGAREAAWRKLLARAELGPDAAPLDALGRSKTRAFVSEVVTEDGGRLHRVHFAIEGVSEVTARLRAQVLGEEARARREPVVRIGLSVLLGAALLVIYLFVDLKTRGYLSTPLKILFGILLVVGLLATWRVSP